MQLKDRKHFGPMLTRFTLRSTAIVASSFAIYEFFLDDWGSGIGYGVSWILIILLERKLNWTKPNSKD